MTNDVFEHLKQEIEWLIERVKKLGLEKRELKGLVEFLKKELQYQDYKGEVMSGSLLYSINLRF